MKPIIVYSGYLRCTLCKQVTAKTDHGVCASCKRRDFEYGVMNGDVFMSYQKLKDCVQLGYKFRDGANNHLPITRCTFGVGHVVKRNRTSK